MRTEGRNEYFCPHSPYRYIRNTSTVNKVKNTLRGIQSSLNAAGEMRTDGQGKYNNYMGADQRHAMADIRNTSMEW